MSQHPEGCVEERAAWRGVAMLANTAFAAMFAVVGAVKRPAAIKSRAKVVIIGGGTALTPEQGKAGRFRTAD